MWNDAAGVAKESDGYGGPGRGVLPRGKTGTGVNVFPSERRGSVALHRDCDCGFIGLRI